MKVFILLAAVTAVAIARPEPPVGNRSYLPPSVGGHSTAGRNGGYKGLTAASFGGQQKAPSSKYGPPSEKYTPPSDSYGPPSDKFGPPAEKYGPPADKYGPPKGGVTTEDPLAEPASYKFEYKVQDEEAGLDFDHQEEREGEEAKGEYRVLLPDGRTLIVVYTANESGYNPEIRYEEAKNNNGPY